MGQKFTEEGLAELIQFASSQGKPDLVKFYQTELEKLRKEKKN